MEKGIKKIMKFLRIIMILLITTQKIKTLCGKYCYDCRDNICYTCHKAKWNQSSKKCEQTTNMENCEVWSRDGICVQCEVGYMIEYYIDTTTKQYKIRCKENKDPNSKEKQLKQCLFLTEEQQESGKVSKCYACVDRLRPNSDNTACIPSGVADNCHSYYYFNLIETCYSCSDGVLFFGDKNLAKESIDKGVCYPPVTDMDKCAYAISKKKCVVCRTGFYLHTDGTCLSNNN